MGSSTIAHCDACGYDSNTLLTGGGMRNHQTYDARLVSCPQCREITTANFKATNLTCLKCGGTEITPVVGRGPALCPKCGKAKLRFQDGGIMWD
jgi:hypothetical protein